MGRIAIRTAWVHERGDNNPNNPNASRRGRQRSEREVSGERREESETESDVESGRDLWRFESWSRFVEEIDDEGAS